MRIIASKRSQRFINLALAAVLVVSTLTASVPFLFGQKANAAPGVSYTTPSESQSDWTVDRSVPSGNWSVDSGTKTVTLNVDQTNANPAGTFYQTEGVRRSVAAGTDSIKGDVVVNSSWSSVPNLRVGLWGVAQDAGNTGPSYPIIEYATNIAGHTDGWRVWNANDSTWNDVTATTHLDAANTVEIVSNVNDGNYDFYVNNVKVYSYDAAGYTTFTDMILNNYNAASGNTADNYTVTWDNIQNGDLTPADYSNVYVATTGSDTDNDGTTAAAPFATIQKALDKVAVNGTVHVAAGTYSAQGLNIHTAGTKLVGDAGAKLEIPAVVDGAQVNAVNIAADNVTVSGFEIESVQVANSYLVHDWSNNTIERGIAVPVGVTGFTITGNNIHNVRNGILVDGRNGTGNTITGNKIENTKGAISVQYTDATGVAITGNTQGPIGNAWAVNLHLNGHFDANVYSGAKIAVDAPTAAQSVIRDLSTANSGWSVQDQGYSTSNRSEVNVSSLGSATNQGDLLGTIDTIANGINAVIVGGHVKTNGNLSITTATNVSKKVIIDGQGTTDVHTSGGAQLFTFLTDGSTFENFKVVKDDNADQDILGIQANDTTIIGNIFTGHFVIADNAGVTRALVVSTSTGTNIEGDNFINLRQPAYINDNATGTIKDNYTSGTKGFVLVANSNFSFTGNGWGPNVTDIAIIDNDANPATPIVNNYTCSVMLTIKANNNDASIDNQVLTSPCPVEAPTNPQWLLHDGTVLGAYTNVNLVTPSWTAPATGADHYEYSYKSPTDPNWSAPAAFTATSIPDQSFYGAGNNGTEGTWQYRVRTVASNGDTSVWVEAPTLTYDKTAPTGLANLSPSDGTVGTTASLTHITWTTATDANGPVSYYYESSLSSAVNGDGSFVTPVYQSGALSDTSIPTPNTPAGVYYWHVRAVDAATNSSPWTGAWKITVDNTTPTASFTFPPRGPSATSFTVTYNEAMNVSDATNPANYFLSNWPGAGGSGPLTGHATVTYDPASTTATVTFTTPGWYVSGEQLWGVSNVRDLAGNVITTTTAFSTPLTSPTTPGTPTTTSPTNSFTSVWTWDAATDLPTPAADASGIKGYQYELTDSDNNVVIDWTATTDTTATTNVTADGTYTLHVRALDNAGSPASDESTGTVVVDTTGPNVHVNAGSFTSAQPTITGTVDADAQSINVAIVDSTNTVVESGVATYNPGDTTWSYAVQTVLPNGDYTIFARAFDALGNHKANDAAASITVATPAPETPAADTTTPAPTTTVTPVVTPLITPASAAAVLGATTDNTTNGDTGVKGATDDKTVAAAAVNSDANKGNIFGIAWYWWLLILAALALIAWFIAGAVRRRNENQG